MSPIMTGSLRRGDRSARSDRADRVLMNNLLESLISLRTSLNSVTHELLADQQRIVIRKSKSCCMCRAETVEHVHITRKESSELNLHHACRQKSLHKQSRDDAPQDNCSCISAPKLPILYESLFIRGATHQPLVNYKQRYHATSSSTHTPVTCCRDVSLSNYHSTEQSMYMC